MLQSVSLTPFSASIPVTSRLDLLVFKPEKDQNMSKTSITSIKDYLLLRKNIVINISCVQKCMVKYVKNIWFFCVFIFLNRYKNYS